MTRYLDHPGTVEKVVFRFSSPSSTPPRGGRRVDRRAALEPELCGQTVAQRYQVLARIESGPLADVYHARHETSGKRVVLTALRPNLDPTGEELGELLWAAGRCASLSHPNVVRLLDYGWEKRAEGELYFLVEEFVPALPLSRALEESAPMALDTALHILLQVAGALGAAHEQGVVHGDLHPAHVLLSGPPQAPYVRVDGFAVVGCVGGPRRGLSPRYDRRCDPRYLAPETLRGQAPAQAAADVYAAGALLYHMLAGRAPHDDLHTFELLLDPPDNEPLDLHLASTRFVPAALEGIAQRCLRPDPADRWTDGSALHQALLRLANADGEPHEATPA